MTNGKSLGTIRMFSVFEICRRILKSYGFSLALNPAHKVEININLLGVVFLLPWFGTLILAETHGEVDAINSLYISVKRNIIKLWRCYAWII